MFFAFSFFVCHLLSHHALHSRTTRHGRRFARLLDDDLELSCPVALSPDIHLTGCSLADPSTPPSLCISSTSSARPGLPDLLGIVSVQKIPPLLNIRRPSGVLRATCNATAQIPPNAVGYLRRRIGPFCGARFRDLSIHVAA